MKRRGNSAYSLLLVALTLFAVGRAPAANGQECPETAGVHAAVAWFTPASRVVVSGSHAFLESRIPYDPGGYSYLPITDISDPDGPRVVGTVGMRNFLQDLAISGEYLFVLGGYINRNVDGTMAIVDVSDPAHPETVSEIDWDHPAPSQIAVADGFVYLAGSDGLLILDVADPSNPIEVGSYSSSWEPSDVVTADGLLYLVSPEGGLRLIDVSDPTNPAEIGLLDYTWEALDLEVSNGTAYVADGSGGVRVIDVENPTTPVEIGTLQTDDAALAVSVDGSYATVVIGDSGVLVVDLSDRANPESVGLIATDHPALAVYFTRAMAYVTEATFSGYDWWEYNGKFSVVDLSVPESPVVRGTFGYESTVSDVAISDGVGYLAAGDSGLYVVNISGSTPVTPFMDTPGMALGVTLYGNLALVADGRKGLRIIDVSDPMNMAEIGFIDTPGEARRVAVDGDYAYVADGDGGLRIIDISVPQNPVEVGAVETPEPARDVAIWGNYAYVAIGSDFRVVDISDSAYPFDLLISEPSCATAVAAADGRLLVGCGGLLRMFDVSTPWIPLRNRPDPIYEEYISGVAQDIEVRGHQVYVAISGPGEHLGHVQVFDASDQLHLTSIGNWESDHVLGRRAVTSVDAESGAILVGSGGPVVDLLDGRCLTTYWVEVVAHNSGAQGSQWRSDVVISNETEATASVEFILHTIDGLITAQGSVEAGHQAIFEDIVGVLGYEGKGPLEIQAGVPVTLASRIYTDSDSGTYGAIVPGHRSSDCLGRGEWVSFYGLRQSAGEYRTNFTITNTGTAPGHVGIWLYRSDGEQLAEYTVDVDPGMVVQDLQPFKNRAGQPNIGWGFARIRVLGSEGLLVSASVIDARTNDPTFVPMTR